MVELDFKKVKHWSLWSVCLEKKYSFFFQENMFLIIFLPLHLFWKEKKCTFGKKAIFRVVYYLRLNHVGLIWRNFQSQSFWRGWGCLNLDAFLSRIWGSRGCVQFGLFGVVLLKYHLKIKNKRWKIIIIKHQRYDECLSRTSNARVGTSEEFEYILVKIPFFPKRH